MADQIPQEDHLENQVALVNRRQSVGAHTLV
jgi:hypothetical protein